MPAYFDERQPALSHGGGGLPEKSLPRRPCTSIILVAGKWKGKNEPPTQRNTPLFVFFLNSAPSSQRIQFGSDTLESSAWKPMHCSFFFFFLFFPRRTNSPIHYIDTSSTVWLPLREMRLQFSLQAEAASSASSFLWDSAGVGGVRLHCDRDGGKEGRELCLPAIRQGPQTHRLSSAVSSRSLFRRLFN